MARASIIYSDFLDDGLILTPERYDTQKTQNKKNGVLINELCKVVNETISPKTATSNMKYLVLNTGDVKEGFIHFKATINANEIGSAKKIIKCGDIIISRLRPYLRQVGFVDEGLVNSHASNTVMLCSTEFFVLRSEYDISYLVPFLLTKMVQQILSASQEGGHHPRFVQKVLELLVIDEKLVSINKEISQNLKEAIASLRTGEQQMLKQLESLET